jgi:hypothetical protein
MDMDRFDALVRSLASSPTRRQSLRVLIIAALSGVVSGGTRPVAAKKGKGKGGKKRKKKPCRIPKCCKRRIDCPSSLCLKRRCRTCTATPDNCGSDDFGTCVCRASPGSGNICVRQLSTQASCQLCPVDALCFSTADGSPGFDCVKPCGRP